MPGDFPDPVATIQNATDSTEIHLFNNKNKNSSCFSGRENKNLPEIPQNS